MKKGINALLILALLLCSATAAYAKDPAISVYIEGAPITFEEPPVIIDGTTMVPFRPVFEKLGIQVSWNADTGTVLGKKEKWNISLTIGQSQATVNGEAKVLPRAAEIINGNTFIPLRFVGEVTGRNVLWDNDTRTIRILSSMKSQTIDILYSNDLTYEGELKGGIKEGKGKYMYKNTLWYEGDFKANKMEGHGKQYDPNNHQSYYEGQFVNNFAQGQGKLVYDNGFYHVGAYKAGVREGAGKLYDHNNKLFFEGSFADNAIEGLGTYYYPDGSLDYAGMFKKGFLDGLGKTYHKGQLTYEGEFVQGKMQGKGKMYSPTEPGILWYEGEFKDNSPHGVGKMYDKKGRLAYEGEFKSFNETGKGKIYYENGQVYEGEVYNSMPEGMGRLTDASGKVISKGYFENGTYKSTSPDEKNETYIINKLKKEFTQQVIDGINPNSYYLKPTEAIMFLELPSKDALTQFQQLSESGKKQLINSYVQDHWGHVIGVNHCYAKVVYQGSTFAEADISYLVANNEVKLNLYQNGK